MALMQFERPATFRSAQRLLLMPITAIGVVAYLVILLLIVGVLAPLSFFGFGSGSQEEKTEEDREDRYRDW